MLFNIQFVCVQPGVFLWVSFFQSILRRSVGGHSPLGGVEGVSVFASHPCLPLLPRGKMITTWLVAVCIAYQRCMEAGGNLPFHLRPTLMKSMLHSCLTIAFFFFPCYASAYTWQFTSQPRQCQNLSIAVQGSGQPPYSLLLIPTGPSPLPNNTEVRTIQNISFTGTSTSLSFNLNYPETSSFVAVVCLYLDLFTAAPLVVSLSPVTLPTGQ